MSIREKAAKLLADEVAEEALAGMKEKLRQLRAAKIVVANIEREVEDLEEAIEQGNA